VEGYIIRKIPVFCGRVHASNESDPEIGSKKAAIQLGIKKEVKLGSVLMLLLVVCTASGRGQQSTTFKVKHSSTSEKASPKAPVMTPKTKGSETASAANSKDLQSIEHEKPQAPARAGANKTPALKPVKDKPNPPINFSGAGGTKSAGMTRQNANPYAGRLKQKYAHQ
jgi:hypothetical protein